jgi:hypothetical protein
MTKDVVRQGHKIVAFNRVQITGPNITFNRARDAALAINSTFDTEGGKHQAQLSYEAAV